MGFTGDNMDMYYMVMIQPSGHRPSLYFLYLHNSNIYIKFPVYLFFHLIIKNPDGNETVPRSSAAPVDERSGDKSTRLLHLVTQVENDLNIISVIEKGF